MGHRRLAAGLAAGFVVAGCLLAVPAPAAFAAKRTGSGWALPKPPGAPNVTNYDSPLAISCGSATSCKAVGSVVNVGGLEQTLIESWNGTAWVIAASPNNPASGMSSNSLTGVSCVSPTFCVAVGYYVNPTPNVPTTNAIQTLIETWNGTSWSVPSTLPDNGTSTNVLSGVSCLSTTSCTAVGYSAMSTTGVIQTLVASWNGTTWSVIPSADSGSGNNSLSAVSCKSTTSCQAVGSTTNGSGIGQALIETWNGSTWALAAPTNSVTTTNVLQGVACTSATSCQAVGYLINSAGVIQTLVASLSGTSWTVMAGPNTTGAGTGSNALYAVACPTASTCEAVGYYLTASSVIQTLVASWNGTSWTASPGPITSPLTSTSTNALYGVACPSTTSCLAAGSYATSAGILQSLVESWNGTAWAISSGLPGGVLLADSLADVSCESTGFCEAVGNYQGGSKAKQTLAESWYQRAWSILPVPDAGTGNNALASVSCVSTTYCMAVGSSTTNSVQQSLIETWNGAAWSVPTNLPNNGTGGNALAGVSCVSSTFCVAVGYSRNSKTNVQQSLVDVWNGTSWTSSNPAATITTGNFLTGVSCLSTTLCQAVGSFLLGGKTSRPLIATLSGTTWSRPPVSADGAGANFLNGVSCAPSTTSCQAVGYFLNPSNVKQAMVLSWSGSTWSVPLAPTQPTTVNNEFRGISCVTTTFCQAVGDSAPGGTAQAFAETLNGTTWGVASLATGVTGPSTLGGVACWTTTACAAVGQYTQGGVLQTLIELFT